ncbi:MAG TPA: hypothetical protein DIS75_05785 [Chryseobacterium sp.]|nr:hypothetical protein [Chryseobacterium sp.]
MSPFQGFLEFLFSYFKGLHPLLLISPLRGSFFTTKVTKDKIYFLSFTKGNISLKIKDFYFLCSLYFQEVQLKNFCDFCG